MFRNDEGALGRRGFLKLVGVGLVAYGTTATSVAAGAKVARLANVVAPGGAVDRACNDFAKAVAEKSKGELTVQVFPGGQLGGERDMVESVQLGSIEIGVFGSYVMANVTPEWGLPIDTPYAMRNQEHFRKVVDGPLAKPIYDAMLQRKGIRHVAWANRGPRYLTSNKPVKTPADLKGVKIRVPEVETYLAAWKMLGATVTPMAFPEVGKGDGPILETLRIIARDSYFSAVEVTWMKDPAVRQQARALLDTAALDVIFAGQPPLLMQKLNLNAEDEKERAKAIRQCKESADQAYELGACMLAVLSGPD
ncbi:MAG: TRAP transporter substrate-binding protein DctP, partial [Thermodesulfobacteriota bacterium]